MGNLKVDPSSFVGYSTSHVCFAKIGFDRYAGQGFVVVLVSGLQVDDDVSNCEVLNIGYGLNLHSSGVG